MNRPSRSPSPETLMAAQRLVQSIFNAAHPFEGRVLRDVARLTDDDPVQTNVSLVRTNIRRRIDHAYEPASTRSQETLNAKYLRDLGLSPFRRSEKTIRVAIDREIARHSLNGAMEVTGTVGGIRPGTLPDDTPPMGTQRTIDEERAFLALETAVVSGLHVLSSLRRDPINGRAIEQLDEATSKVDRTIGDWFAVWGIDSKTSPTDVGAYATLFAERSDRTFAPMFDEAQQLVSGLSQPESLADSGMVETSIAV